MDNFNKPTHLSMPIWERLHIDLFLLISVLALVIMGLFILFSASNQSTAIISRQSMRLALGFCIMLICAQVPPRKYYKWAPWIFAVGTFLLLAVLIMGHIGKGAQRWLGLGFLRFQPSELMKLAVPMLLARFLSEQTLPPSKRALAICGLLIAIPMLLIAKEPDLGTAIIIALAGACVLLLAGMQWRIILGLLAVIALCLPVLWHFMHHYQHERVLTFLNPERDPLGAGYHIIQSKIAIGSGGFFGKGWLEGTQSHLQFLPEHATDFIFAVCGEELGFIGSLLLLTLFLFAVGRGLYISTLSSDTFSRLLAGSLSLLLFFSVFINMGMVTGIVPVVGVPLPLVSYGGTSMVTLMASFGIIMSVYTHRNLVYA